MFLHYKHCVVADTFLCIFFCLHDSWYMKHVHGVKQTNDRVSCFTHVKPKFEVVYMLGTWHVSDWENNDNYACNSFILKDIYLLKTENIIHNNYSTYQTYTTILIMKIILTKSFNLRYWYQSTCKSQKFVL